MMKFALVLSFLVAAPLYVNGHGMVMDPVNRASRWRVDSSAPVNYDDNQLYCGSFGQQWVNNGGKCGFCGDNYADAQPRKHEIGGKYGQGVIVKSYKQGSDMQVQVQIDANHRGFFQFKVCNLDTFKTESEECYDSVLLTLPSGETKYYLEYILGKHDVTLKLPSGLTCKHCVLQWTYTTANSWGTCEDGTAAQGCGPQEWFRTCSDIAITA
ncbi:uncharacterized protein LOC143915185 [Arctopsyche grandis]|uniref:uncharacterized protein LOC143915185 n=1 Tax=Arctopsyche grandis TaxID=121162 RepID=UPI00406D9A79